MVVFPRDNDFAERRLRLPGEAVHLPTLGVSIALAEIYRDTGLGGR